MAENFAERTNIAVSASSSTKETLSCEEKSESLISAVLAKAGRSIAWMSKVMGLKPYIGEDHIANIKHAKYVCGNFTPFEELHEAYLWRPGVQLLPRWLHPNIITLVAMLFSTFFTIVPIVLFDFGRRGCHRIFYLIAAISVWIYQFLDAVDGKQARRLKLASPIGQLFDHGCDAITTHVFVFLFFYVVNIRHTWILLTLLQCMSYNLLYSAWYEYEHKIFLTLVSGYISVTELQYMVISYLLLTFFWPGIWQIRPLHWLPAILSTRLDYMPFSATISDILSFGCVIASAILNFKPTLKMLKSQQLRSVPDTWNIFMTLQLHFVAQFFYGASGLFYKHPMHFTIIIAFFSANIVWRFILSNCSECPLRLLDVYTLPYYIGSMVIYSLKSHGKWMTFASYLISLYAIIYKACFVRVNMRQLADICNIELFRVPSAKLMVDNEPSTVAPTAATTPEKPATESPKAEDAVSLESVTASS